MWLGSAHVDALGEEDAALQARTRWQTLMILRFAICELIAIASIAVAFVLPHGDLLTYAGGRSSGLRETFGFSGPGPVQRL